MKTLSVVAIAAMLSSCSTMNQSLELGATMGAASGIASAYAGSIGQKEGPTFSTVAIASGISMGIGMLTSYFVHKSVEEDRASSQADQIDMNFGDLPPSPFIIPKQKQSKKGGR